MLDQKDMKIPQKKKATHFSFCSETYGKHEMVSKGNLHKSAH